MKTICKSKEKNMHKPETKLVGGFNSFEQY